MKIEHIAFSVGSKERVDELTAQMKQDGYEVISGPRTTGDGYYVSCTIGVGGKPDRNYDLEKEESKNVIIYK